MKKFAFALESVLELKRRREEALLEELAKRLRAATSAEGVLRELRAERSQALAEMRALLRGRLELNRVRTARDFVAGLDGRIEEQVLEVDRRNQEVEACRQEVIAAAQERKTLEKLREREREAYQKEFERQEQAFLDELATQRFARQEKTANGRTVRLAATAG